MGKIRKGHPRFGRQIGDVVDGHVCTFAAWLVYDGAIWLGGAHTREQAEFDRSKFVRFSTSDLTIRRHTFWRRVRECRRRTMTDHDDTWRKLASELQQRVTELERSDDDLDKLAMSDYADQMARALRRAGYFVSRDRETCTMGLTSLRMVDVDSSTKERARAVFAEQEDK